MSNGANGFLPLGTLPRGPPCGFTFVNRTQQRVRGLGFFKWGSKYHTPAASVRERQFKSMVQSTICITNLDA